MKALAWLAVVIGLPLTASADDKKEPPKEESGLKCVIDQFDKAWGIKFKSMKVTEGKSLAVVTITLDFTKDVADVAEMRKAFVGTTRKPAKLDTHPIVFYLFDADNVSLDRYVIASTQGDLTGAKGDAFRIQIEIDKEVLKKAKKLEARLPNPPKAKD